ncbi:carbohydrate ABC transporter permease [Microbacterium sp. DT81.1]|uniref:carbohydrate ABC transporter permease n=1 Tax=Microbacterium sp. DT81.1 TaxID=3393413 RepID=UPI003CEE9C58
MTRTRSRSFTRLGQPALVLLLLLLLIAVPFWLVLSTSGKPLDEALNPNLDPPSTWQLAENYSEAATKGEIWLALLGSVTIVVPAVLIVLILGAMAAWVFARRSGRMAAALYAVGISGVLIPPAAVTLVVVLRQLGLAGTSAGLIGVYSGMYLSLVIFFITGFVRTVPIELEEAARVDGAGPVKVFFRIILPLLSPVMATSAILVTLFAWNDVFYAFFVLGGGNVSTIPLNLFKVANTALYTNAWNLIFAYVVLASVPLVALFAVAQRRIISGVTSGAVK